MLNMETDAAMCRGRASSLSFFVCVISVIFVKKHDIPVKQNWVSKQKGKCNNFASKANVAAKQQNKERNLKVECRNSLLSQTVFNFWLKAQKEKWL